MAREIKVGDKVLAVGYSSHVTAHNALPPAIEKGKEYVVSGINYCSSCGDKKIELIGFNRVATLVCSICGKRSPNTFERYTAKAFILPDLESLHQHRTEVSAKELLTIKEIQHQ